MSKQDEMEKNLKFFYDNLSKWLSQIEYRNKHVVISDKKVKGVFDYFSDAFKYAMDKFPSKKFIIQHVIDPEEEVSFIMFASIEPCRKVVS